MRSLLLTGVLLLTTFSAAPVQAKDSVRVACGVVSGMDYCVTDTLTEDIILILGPDGGERITVDCSTGKWRAHGTNTQQFVENIVSIYCTPN